MNHRRVCLFLFPLSLAITTPAGAAQYKSLRDFCDQTRAASPADCKCGEKTAMDIATPKERKLMLDMMTAQGQEKAKIAQSMSPQQIREITGKLTRITAGCQQ